MSNFEPDDFGELRAYRERVHAYSAARRFWQWAQATFSIMAPVKSGGLGLDASHWQTYIDALAAQVAGILYGVFRALYGLSHDTKFPQHWAGFKGVMPRGAYLYYLDTQDPLSQADKLFQTVPASDREEITVVIDVEGYNNPILTIGKIKQCCERLTVLFGKKPLIYTGYYVWQGIAGNKAWAVDYPLWIAGYPLTGWADDYPTKVLSYLPLIPYPWTMWSDNPDEPLEGHAAFWQWTSSAPASKYGSSGLYLDLNHVSPAAAKKYGIGTTEPPPPDPIGEIMYYADVVYLPPGVTYRNIRSKPHSSGSQIGLDVGDVVLSDNALPVYGVVNNNEGEWVHLLKGETVGWVLSKAGGVTYLQLNEVTP